MSQNGDRMDDVAHCEAFLFNFISIDKRISSLLVTPRQMPTRKVKLFRDDTYSGWSNQYSIQGDLQGPQRHIVETASVFLKNFKLRRVYRIRVWCKDSRGDKQTNAGLGAAGHALRTEWTILRSDKLSQIVCEETRGMRRETEPVVDEKTTQRKIRGVARDMFKVSFTMQAPLSTDLEVDY
ncbi:hypothetical protein Bca4012_076488 [Brassica carinata]